jgi:Protein of unknown function (DUF998)
MWRRPLLMCGMASSVLYAAMNVFVPMAWPGYDSSSRMVSELSAIDAPSRALWVPFGVVYTLLVALFGWGVWQSAGRRRWLRAAGAVFVACGLAGLGWPPMHQRDVLAAGGKSLTDTLHIAWTIANVGLMLVAMALCARGFGPAFRAYTLVTMALLAAIGAVTGQSAPRVEANLPTPWIGVWERIDIALLLIWTAALAVVLLREPPERPAAAAPGAQPSSRTAT